MGGVFIFLPFIICQSHALFFSSLPFALFISNTPFTSLFWECLVCLPNIDMRLWWCIHHKPHGITTMTTTMGNEQQWKQKSMVEPTNEHTKKNRIRSHPSITNGYMMNGSLYNNNNNNDVDAVESSRAETSVGVPSYKTHMKLTIFSVTADDFGVVKCVAKNPRGETDGTIRLYSKFKHFHFIIMYSHV